MIKLPKVNRVEVIDHTESWEHGGGRCYIKWDDNISVAYDLQDKDRTLKIFITNLQGGKNDQSKAES